MFPEEIRGCFPHGCKLTIQKGTGSDTLGRFRNETLLERPWAAAGQWPQEEREKDDVFVALPGTRVELCERSLAGKAWRKGLANSP